MVMDEVFSLLLPCLVKESTLAFDDLEDSGRRKA